MEYSHNLPEQGIERELSFSELFSKTFELFRKDFAKYVGLFAIVGAIVGTVTALAQHYFVFQTLSSTPTVDQVLAWLPGFLTTLFLLVGTIFAVTVVFFPIAQGSAIKMASEQIEKGQAELGETVGYAASRLLSIWGLSIIVGVIVTLGFIALVIPGIILTIMFLLAFPVLLIEKKGIVDSMGRSRQLVGNRWLKTLVVFLVLGIGLAIASSIVSAISAPFGIASPVVNGLLSAFYQPIFPIMLTVYYYSSLARTMKVTLSQPLAPSKTSVEA